MGASVLNLETDTSNAKPREAEEIKGKKLIENKYEKNLLNRESNRDCLLPCRKLPQFGRHTNESKIKSKQN